MQCENNFCIYNKKGACIIDGPEIIDINGMCSECIYVDINEDELDKIKKEQLKKIGDIHLWNEK